MNIIAIIQARMSSTRLPGKILTDLCGKPMLLQITERISKSKLISKCVIATSNKLEDDAVEDFAKQYHINLFRGSLLDVLGRFYLCAVTEKADVIVRFTGDNALIDPYIIDLGIQYYLQNKGLDYIRYRKGLPIGMAVEIFSFDALKRSYQEAIDKECREHVTPYIYRNENLFKIKICDNMDKDYSNLRWTLDTEQDLKLIKSIYENLYPQNKEFTYSDILETYKYHPEWLYINTTVSQNQVVYKGK